MRPNSRPRASPAVRAARSPSRRSATASARRPSARTSSATASMSACGARRAHDVGAGLGQRTRAPRADALAGAGDDRDAPSSRNWSSHASPATLAVRDRERCRAGRRRRAPVRLGTRARPTTWRITTTEWGRPVVDDARCTRSCASKASRQVCRGSRSCASASASGARSRDSMRRRSRATASATSTGCSATRASCVTAARSRRRSPTPRAIVDVQRASTDRWPRSCWSFEPSATPAGTARVRRHRRPRPRSRRRCRRSCYALGFRFVGPTTVYATMQSCGIVDDHLSGCAARAAL